MFDRSTFLLLSILRINCYELYLHLFRCSQDGLVKQIGVSNYNEWHLGELLDYAEIRPMASQFEIHPFNTREKLVQMCQASDKEQPSDQPRQLKGLHWTTLSLEFSVDMC